MKTRIPFVALAVLSTLACTAPSGEDTEGGSEALATPPISSPAPARSIGPVSNACGNMATSPTLTSTNFASPAALDSSGNAPASWNPATGRYVSSGIQYVSGNAVRLELATDGCTYIQQVKIGSTVVTPSYTSGYWYSVSDEQSDTSKHVMSLWLFYPGAGDGSSDDVSITIGRSAGSGTVGYSFPLVRVKAVQASWTDASIGTSGAEMYNMFAKSLDSTFNGATDSTVINGRRLYGYDPNGLSVYIDQTGIWFSFKFKADVADWCDPTVKVTGTFGFDTSVSGLKVRWINPVYANLDWGICGALVDIPIAGLAADIAYSIIGDDGTGASVQNTLTTDIMNALPDLGQAALFLDGTTTSANLLSVKLKLPFPSVELAVPYDAYDMARTPTRVPAGQKMMLLATGLGMNDTVARVSPQTTLYSGPAGVPRDDGVMLANLRKVARSGALVDNSSAVGRLLGKTSTVLTSSTWRYTPGCSISAGASGIKSLSAPNTISFGVNDTAADAQRLRSIYASGYSMRMFFGAGGTPCSVTSQGPVVLR